MPNYSIRTVKRELKAHNLSKVNLHSLRTVLAVLRKTPVDNFSLSNWFTGTQSQIKAIRKANACGYSACIVGHLAAENKLGFKIGPSGHIANTSSGDHCVQFARQLGVSFTLAQQLILPQEREGLYGDPPSRLNMDDSPPLKSVIRTFEIIQQEVRKTRGLL